MNTIAIAIIIKGMLVSAPAHCSAPRPLATDATATVRVCEIRRSK